VERNAREREREAALASQEPEQPAIEHQNPSQRCRSEAEQPDVKWRQQDEYAGEADEARTDSLVQLHVEVVEDVPAGEDQARPREGATPDVRPNDGQESPPLEMRPLEMTLQPDPVAAGAQPIAKLDILDRGERKTLGIESSAAEEDGSPYGAASPPRRSRLLDSRSGER